jgi:FkbM family methyltransferase
MHWYQDKQLVKSLPPLYRVCAFYCVVVAKLLNGKARGARPLLVRLIMIAKSLRMPETTAIQVDGITLWINLYDPRIMFAMDEIRGTGVDFKIIKSVLRPGDLFVDVGANHGTYSLIAAQVVGSTGKVVTFEPQPCLANLIRKSCVSNNIDYCDVHELACSDHEGKVNFYIPKAWSGSASLFLAQTAKMPCEKIEVQLVTLDSILTPITQSLPEKARTFLKVDAEGSEMAALRGAETFIRTHRPWIHFELNPETAHAAQQSQDSVVELLSSWGYEDFAEVEEFPKTRPLGEIDRSRQRNLMAIPSQ